MSRLRWRCRRGIREMDLLLEGFLSGPYRTLSATERATFERLLDEADPDLIAWISGRAEPADPDYRALIAQLRVLRQPTGGDG
jgi:antitoxin CptB